MLWLADIAALAGFALTLWGISLWSEPAAFVVGGSALWGGGLWMARQNAWRRRNQR